jgi:hypothetical protein
VSNVIQGPWGQKSLGTHPVKAGEYRSFEQCCIQQEQAFSAGIYYVVYMTNMDRKRCYVLRGTKEEAKAQINLRNQENEDDFDLES